jgi:hypothetical protein
MLGRPAQDAEPLESWLARRLSEDYPALRAAEATSS